MNDTTDVMEWWWRFQPLIANEALAKDGLRVRREALEEIVAPYVTKKKTKDKILFKGKRQYVELPDGEQESTLAFAAILGLQCAYNVESAWKANNIDELLHWAYGFARCDHDVELIRRSGYDSVGNAALLDYKKIVAHQRCVNGGKNSTKWNEDIAEKARKILDQVTCNGNVSKEEAYRRTKDKLKSEHEISIGVSTLKRRLPFNSKR